MQLISLQQRQTRPNPPHPWAAVASRPEPDDDPPPKGGLAIHLRDLRFDPPVIADAMARWAA